MMMLAGAIKTIITTKLLSAMPMLAQYQHLGASSQGGSMHGGGGLLIVGLGLFVCVGIGALLLFAFWIWMLIDCITRDFQGDNEKVIWVLVIVLLHAIGALIYLFAGRSRGTPSRI